MSATLNLPTLDGAVAPFTIRNATTWAPPTGAFQKRIAYAAAHVVADPLADRVLDAFELSPRGSETHGGEIDLLLRAQLRLTREDLLAVELRARCEQLSESLDPVVDIDKPRGQRTEAEPDDVRPAKVRDHAAFDQSGLDEKLQVAGNPRLRLTEDRGEILHRQFSRADDVSARDAEIRELKRSIDEARDTRLAAESSSQRDHERLQSVAESLRAENGRLQADLRKKKVELASLTAKSNPEADKAGANLAPSPRWWWIGGGALAIVAFVAGWWWVGNHGMTPRPAVNAIAPAKEAST